MSSNRPTDHTALLDNAAWVRRLARRLIADEQLAEDVAQDTLTAAIENPPPFHRDVPRLRRWLGGVTRHLVARAWNRDRERSAREAKAVLEAERRGEEDAARCLELHQVLVVAVHALSEPYRSTVVMRYFDDLATGGIAKRQGVPPATVRKRLSRAMQLLRVRLDREFDNGRRGWCVALVGMLETGGGATPAVTLAKAVPAMVAAGALMLLGLGWHALRGAGGQESPSTLQVPLATADTPEEPDVVEASTSTEGARRVLSSAAGIAPLDLLVVDAQGNPSPEALVLRVVEGEALRRAITDTAGRASFSGLEIAGHVVAQSADGPPTLLSLGELTGRHELVVREGRTLSGRLTEDDDPPRGPVELTLTTLEDPLEPLDERLQQRLADAGVRLGRREQETAEDGSFSYHALPEDWSGSLALPTTHRFLEAPPAAELRRQGWSISLRAPTTDLALRTMRLPLARGRVLDAETMEPIAGAGMMIQASFGGRDQTPLTGARTDSEGRFVLGLWPSSSSRRIAWRDPMQRRALEWLRISVSGIGDCLGIERRFDPARIGPDGDVGDLLLPRGRSVHLRVVDSAGEPISGAVASPRPMSSPTDQDGRTCLRGVPPERESIFIGSPIHRIREVPIGLRSDSREDPLEVVLEPGNRLELSVICEPQEAAKQMRVRLAGRGRLFEVGRRGWGTYLHSELGSQRMFASNGGDEWEYTDYLLDETGRITLLHLVPGVELDVTVQVGDLELARTRLRGPDPGEIVREELVVDRRPLSVDVAVVDVAGRPLPRAKVHLEGIDGGGRATTDSSGVARFERLWASEGPASLSVRCDGHAGRQVEGLALERGATLPTVMLERGRSVQLEIVDEGGASLRVDGVQARAEGFPGTRGERLVEGGFELTDLPSGAIDLEVSYALRTYSHAHQSLEPFATLVLPTHGALECRAAPGIRRTDEEWYWLHVRALDDDEVGTTAYLTESNGRLSWRSPLLPARYGLQLVRVRRTEDGRTESPVGEERIIDIHPSETTHVRLGQ